MQFAEVMLRTAAILQAGVSALQYRDKSGDLPAQRVRAEALRDLCRASGTPFLVNDDPALAAAVEADGVHLGMEDPSLEAARQLLQPGAIIGVSCYDDVERARKLARSGADYVAFGAFFPTETKTSRATASLETIHRSRPHLHQPIVAIGGITPENSEPLVKAGVDMLAVISSLYYAKDPAHQVRRFQELFEPGKGAPQ
jgi:thiamine-phosphate pyrophosphorylase